MINKLKKYQKDIEIAVTLNNYNKFLDLKDFFIHRGCMVGCFNEDKFYTFTHFSDSVSIVPDMSYHTITGIIWCYDK